MHRTGEKGKQGSEGHTKLWIRVREQGPNSSSATNSLHDFSSCSAMLCLSFLLWGMETVDQVKDSQSLLHLLLMYPAYISQHTISA